MIDDKILADSIKGKTIDRAIIDDDDNLVLCFTDLSVISVDYCCYGGVSLTQQKNRSFMKKLSLDIKVATDAPDDEIIIVNAKNEVVAIIENIGKSENK